MPINSLEYFDSQSNRTECFEFLQKKRLRLELISSWSDQFAYLQIKCIAAVLMAAYSFVWIDHSIEYIAWNFWFISWNGFFLERFRKPA